MKLKHAVFNISIFWWTLCITLIFFANCLVFSAFDSVAVKIVVPILSPFLLLAFTFFLNRNAFFVVHISSDGIHKKLFKKSVLHLDWADITKISVNNLPVGLYYNIVFESEKGFVAIRFDGKKLSKQAIKQAFALYCPLSEINLDVISKLDNLELIIKSQNEMKK